MPYEVVNVYVTSPGIQMSTSAAVTELKSLAIKSLLKTDCKGWFSSALVCLEINSCSVSALAWNLPGYCSQLLGHFCSVFVCVILWFLQSWTYLSNFYNCNLEQVQSANPCGRLLGMFIRAAGGWDTVGMTFKCTETLQTLWILMES